jgi:iron complex transport system ATP-binding protein
VGEAAAVAFEGVGFGYRSVPVFRDLTLRIEPGSFVALLGPNGTGKTTWVRLAAANVRPGSGRVTLFGEDVARLPARQRARIVAVVPQDSPSGLEWPVREVVALGRAPHLGLLGLGSAADRRVVDEAMGTTGVSHLADRGYGTLSGGERQRVVIARALAQQPRLLILDEPTASLDLKHRTGVYGLLGRLHREHGLTVVVVTHDVDLAARHAHRIVLLHGGGVAADGPPQAVLTARTLGLVYDVAVDVVPDPGTGSPHVVPRGEA